LARLGGTTEMLQSSVVYSALRKMLNTIMLTYYMFTESMGFWLDNKDHVDHLAFWESINAGWYQMYRYVGSEREL
jgi:hypothetical protein